MYAQYFCKDAFGSSWQNGHLQQRKVAVGSLNQSIVDLFFLEQAAVFFLNGPIPASFCLFSFFSHSNSNDKYTIWTIKIEKSVDGVLGTRTRGGMMEGADESTELLSKVETVKL